MSAPHLTVVRNADTTTLIASKQAQLPPPRRMPLTPLEQLEQMRRRFFLMGVALATASTIGIVAVVLR